MILRLSSTLLVASASPLLDAFDGGTRQLHCEDDQQWLQIKRNLYFLMERVTQTGGFDMSRAVSLLTKEVSPEDLGRCPAGAAAVQLFLQLSLAMADAGTALNELHVEPWPSVQDEPWSDIVQLPWPLLLGSRWPIFGILDAMRDVFLGFQAPPPTSCTELWRSLTGEQQLIFKEGAQLGHLLSLALRLPSDSCAAARVATSVAMLSSLASSGALEAQDHLLQQAQAETDIRWPLDLLHTPWPALELLSRVEKQFAPEADREALVVGELRGAIAYINFRPKDMSRYHDIEKSLETLQTYWLSNATTRWPVIIFVDPDSAAAQDARFRGRYPELDLQLANISQQDLDWPIPHDHAFCSKGYRRAARFTAGPLYMHPALDSVTHLILIDTEFEFTHPVPWDPFRHMFEQRTLLSFWQTHYERTWSRTVYLTEISKEFMAERRLDPQIPELVQYWWDIEEGFGGTFPVNIYGCLFGGAMSFFRSNLFQEYFRTLDEYPGWSQYCWSPQNVLAIAAGFFINDGDLAEMWVFGRHQNSSKTPNEGWNDSKQGVLPIKKLQKTSQ